MKTANESSTVLNTKEANHATHKKTLWQRWWPWLRRLLTLIFFALVAWLLVSHARSVDWQEVKSALLGYSPLKVGIAILFAIGAYFVYSCYDLFGRHFIKTQPTRLKTMAVAFISFAFNLNLGALVGSIGLRYRMYSRLGLGKAEIAHIVGMTISTNWLGYLLLSGIAFASGSISVPLDWAISGPVLRILGFIFVGIVIAYIALCRFSPKRHLHIRDHELTLPSSPVALLQVSMACAHWLLMGAVMHTYLPQIDFLTLFGVLLVSSIAGAAAHIPGALGVLEAVFIAFLSGEASKSELLAGLIAYRATFYLIPLALAVLTYIYMEVKEL